MPLWLPNLAALYAGLEELPRNGRRLALLLISLVPVSIGIAAIVLAVVR